MLAAIYLDKSFSWDSLIGGGGGGDLPRSKVKDAFGSSGVHPPPPRQNRRHPGPAKPLYSGGGNRSRPVLRLTHGPRAASG